MNSFTLNYIQEVTDKNTQSTQLRLLKDQSEHAMNNFSTRKR